MAYTQTDLTNVEQAILALASGKRRVRFVIDGDAVEYSQVALPDLRSLRNEIAAEIDQADTTTGTSSFQVVGVDKGF